MNLKHLSEIIKLTHVHLHRQAVKAVNVNLTIRNWLFGFYIIEFEQNGEDRAVYGEKLFFELSRRIAIKGLSETNLKICRQFYKTYPQLLGSIIEELKLSTSSIEKSLIRQSVSDELQLFDNLLNTIRQAVTDEFIQGTSGYQIKLIKSTSFTHFVELIKIEDHIKRKFYELLILKTTPSVRELIRSIETLTYERFGLSGNKEVAFEQIRRRIDPASPDDIVKSHYFFEFLEIKQPQLIEEKELEQALLDHLHDFILEMGNGFCFEARQKRILIDDEYYFIDLVFYHRILKCHVLIELKTEQAKYDHIGQLKVYLQYYKHKVMTPEDNPPVGILLVTDKKQTLVEYAVAESDKELFVTKYQLQLPTKDDLEAFIANELLRI